MAIEVHEGGGMSITGEHIDLYRLLTIRSGLSLEAKGLRLTRGISCLSIVRREFGIKAKTAAAALPLFEARLRAAGVLRDAPEAAP
jgi:hypothetical protein